MVGKKILTVQRLLRGEKGLRVTHNQDPHPGAGRAEAEATAIRLWWGQGDDSRGHGLPSCGQGQGVAPGLATASQT